MLSATEQPAEHATHCRRSLNADSGVRYWTDYLKMHLHPRSKCLLPGWQDGTSPQGFGEGAAGLESSETKEAALDRVRFWAEECDTLQVSSDRSERAAFSFRMSAAAWQHVKQGVRPKQGSLTATGQLRCVYCQAVSPRWQRCCWGLGQGKSLKGQSGGPARSSGLLDLWWQQAHLWYVVIDQHSCTTVFQAGQQHPAGHPGALQLLCCAWLACAFRQAQSLVDCPAAGQKALSAGLPVASPGATPGAPAALCRLPLLSSVTSPSVACAACGLNFLLGPTLQGFQCFVDDQTGFGRLAADLLPDLRDDYGAQPLLLFPVRAQQPPASSDAAAVCAWRLSAALSMGLLSQQASLYTIVANPSPALPQLACLRWRPGNPFHASALCASVLDSALVACRLAQHPLSCSLGPPIGELRVPFPLLEILCSRAVLGALCHVRDPLSSACWLTAADCIHGPRESSSDRDRAAGNQTGRSLGSGTGGDAWRGCCVCLQRPDAHLVSRLC